VIDEIREDRLQALLARGETGVAATLDALPFVAAALFNTGPLTRLGRYGGPLGLAAVPEPAASPGSADLVEALRSRKVDLSTVARLSAGRAAIALSLATLARPAQQLAALAAWHGGSIDPRLLATEAPELDDLTAEAARRELADALLADPDRGWLVLRPGVQDMVGLPGHELAEADSFLSSDELRAALVRLGIRPPTRKHERLDALRVALRDPAVVRAALAELDEDSRKLFDALVDHTERGQPVVALADLDVGFFNRYSTFAGRHPVGPLIERCLVGCDTYAQQAWVWLDAFVGVRGRLFTSWPRPEPAPTLPLDSDGLGAAALVTTAERLLQRTLEEPLAATKKVEPSVRAVRSLARQLGVEPDALGLLVRIGIDSGLLTPVVVASRGRGRTRVEDRAFRPTPLAQTWFEQGPADRWRHLAQSWADGGDRDDDVWTSVDRMLSLRLLAELDPGEGVDEAEFAAWFARRHAGVPPADRFVSGARLLGLVPGRGPVGLTELGRAWLAGHADVDAVFAPTEDSFVVQADHTVLAGRGLAYEVLSRLQRLANLESDGAALLYRLDDRRLAEAFASGEDVEDTLAFLEQNSRTPLPAGVRQLVTDAGRRRDLMTVGAAASFVVCDDAAALAQACRVGPAKLSALAPTVAVSSLDPARLMAALRTKGFVVRQGLDDDAGGPESASAGTSAGAARDSTGRPVLALVPDGAERRSVDPSGRAAERAGSRARAGARRAEPPARLPPPPDRPVVARADSVALAAALVSIERGR